MATVPRVPVVSTDSTERLVRRSGSKSLRSTLPVSRTSFFVVSKPPPVSSAASGASLTPVTVIVTVAVSVARATTT